MGGNGLDQGDDYEGKLKEAEQRLERLRQEQEELARRKEEAEQIKRAKEDFLGGQIEMTEKLSAALTAIDRELYEMRTEMSELDELRECFARHAKHLEAVNPDSWSRDSMAERLERAVGELEAAEDDYDQAVEYFSKSERVCLFNDRKKKSLVALGSGSSEFWGQFKSGLAFNLPIIIFGIAALLLLLLGR